MEILFAKFEPPKKEELKAREIKVSVEKKLKDLDLKLVCAVIENVSVKKKHEGLDKKARETIKNTDLKKVEESDVIKGYLELYDAIGVKRDKHAVKNLIEIALQGGKLPTINTVVDSYNLVSIKKGLIVGAHDLDKVSGNVRVKFAEGNEIYVPLGKNEKEKIAKGEYVFADDGVVLCRLDVKQGEHTKVTNETKNVFLYVQGNKYTSQKYLDDALEEICSNITKYCSGKWRKIKVE